MASHPGIPQSLSLPSLTAPSLLALGEDGGRTQTPPLLPLGQRGRVGS